MLSSLPHTQFAEETGPVPDGGNVLVISGLSFAYQSQAKPLLSEISLSARQGEIIALLGASGCGKSTLLNLIAGLMQPLSGEIRINNDTKCGAGDWQRQRRIGYIFQEDALLPWRTVESNLALALELGNVPAEHFRQNVLDLLSAFHLDESVLRLYPSELSGGMRQRAGIIQMLLFNPDLLLLDEPFSALDFYTKLCLENEFHHLVKSKQKTALLVTHDIEEAIALSDRVIILNQQGRLEEEISISFDEPVRDPESVRGLAQFAHYYREIWSKLKAVIAP